MIDLHNHLLPGIDDGAPDLEETLRMGRRAWADGIRTVAATPHLWWDDRENVWATVRMLATEVERFLQEHGVPLRIVSGTEVPTREGTLDLLREGRLPTYGESRWLLLEPPFTAVPPGMDRFVGRLLGSGYRILLAHPERCRTLQERPDIIDTFLPPDMPIQLTSHSLTGEFGERPYQAALAFLALGRPMILASDAHASHRRAPALRDAAAIAAGIVGRGYAEQMVSALPRAIIEDRTIWSPPATAAVIEPSP